MSAAGDGDLKCAHETNTCSIAEKEAEADAAGSLRAF
jgi:hypothetical protein